MEYNNASLAMESLIEKKNQKMKFRNVCVNLNTMMIMNMKNASFVMYYAYNVKVMAKVHVINAIIFKKEN